MKATALVLFMHSEYISRLPWYTSLCMVRSENKVNFHCCPWVQIPFCGTWRFMKQMITPHYPDPAECSAHFHIYICERPHMVTSVPASPKAPVSFPTGFLPCTLPTLILVIPGEEQTLWSSSLCLPVKHTGWRRYLQLVNNIVILKTNYKLYWLKGNKVKFD